MASDIRRPPASQGPQGIDRPDGLRGFQFHSRLVREKAIHRRNLTSSRKAGLRAEAAALRRKAWLRSGASASRALLASSIDLIGALPPSSPIGGYFAIRDELDPLPLLQTLHRTGFRIALPKMCPGPTLTFREWAPNLPLMPGKFGVHEPAGEQPELLPNFVLVPLLAFDRAGNRLGYGAGYYDAALRRFRDSGNNVIAIGMGFDEQEFPEIPREPQDEPLDMILTPTRVIACGDRHAASFSR